MMTRWITALLLTTTMAHAAPAQERGLVLWDENIENSLGRIILENEGCPAYAPSARVREECATAGRQLRQYRRLTDLDRIVLLADRYANARFKQEITTGTELKFRADVPDVLRQKADFKIELDIDF